MSGDPVAALEWRAAVDRVAGLVDEVGEEGLAVRVPACPDWTARDLLSHMVGVGADVLGGTEDADHDPAWTQAQVDARRDASGAELVAEWQALADDLEEHVREQDPRPLLDAVIHEQDLRGALRRPGARDTEGLALARSRIAERFARAVRQQAPVRLESPEWTWTSAEGDPGVVLSADGFTLFRALTSRRTTDQLRSYTVTGDVAPYLEAFAGLGPLPEQPLPE